MNAETLLRERIEREYKYQKQHDVGSEEYNASMIRLNTLEDKLAELEKSKSEKRDRFVKNCIEGVKVASGVALPIFGFVVVTAFEKEDTITSALKGVVNCFLPKKL